jgi:hypothetical protein
VFILYALVAGLLVGTLIGGSWLALGSIRFRWAPLVLIGFLAQIVLFSDAVAERVGEAGPALYVISTLFVGAAVVRNVRLPGMPLIILGAASNMAAILANNGFMPASPEALASLGKVAPVIYSNSSVVARPALELLTDRFALPRWVPAANVFSVGDVVLGVGVVVLVVLTMHRATNAIPREGDGRPDAKRSDGAPSGPLSQAPHGSIAPGGAETH